MNKAFVLGAGLGTRLGKLTECIPKPLIPVYGKPLIEFAFDHLINKGISAFVVNTHHKADAYHDHFPEGSYSGSPITFSHEDYLLGTGGGIDNVSCQLKGDAFMVYNGDILTDLPLDPLLNAHASANNAATLVLRSGGPNLHVAFDPNAGMVTDISNLLQTGNPGTHQFTGIYTCSPGFLEYLQHGKEHSVIPVFLQLIESGLLGAVVIDDGQWWDLGTRESYLDAHLQISRSGFPSYRGEDAGKLKENLTAGASIAPGAYIDTASHIGPGAIIGPGATIRNSIVWPYGEVGPNVSLTRCVVRSAECTNESLENTDV
ncbi:MAG: NTP transferase domain-containing protein [Verrucomicrobiaceae bacterium]|nr:NTP transferase domain-containing protein [Verrucomicrobiaceae bacterium]